MSLSPEVTRIRSMARLHGASGLGALAPRCLHQTQMTLQGCMNTGCDGQFCIKPHVPCLITPVAQQACNIITLVNDKRVLRVRCMVQLRVNPACRTIQRRQSAREESGSHWALKPELADITDILPPADRPLLLPPPPLLAQPGLLSSQAAMAPQVSLGFMSEQLVGSLLAVLPVWLFGIAIGLLVSMVHGVEPGLHQFALSHHLNIFVALAQIGARPKSWSGKTLFVTSPFITSLLSKTVLLAHIALILRWVGTGDALLGLV